MLVASIDQFHIVAPALIVILLVFVFIILVLLPIIVISIVACGAPRLLPLDLWAERLRPTPEVAIVVVAIIVRRARTRR